MVLVTNVFLVALVGQDALRAVSVRQNLQEAALKLFGEVVDDVVGVLRKETHLTQVRLARRVALESVLVATLLLAHLAVPAKLLKTDRLLPIANRLGCHKLVLRHSQIPVLSYSTLHQASRPLRFMHTATHSSLAFSDDEFAVPGVRGVRGFACTA